MREVFQQIPPEFLDRELIRPLGELSDFVVEKLPRLLALVRTQEIPLSILIERIEKLAASQFSVIESLAAQSKPTEANDLLLIARLDILFLNAAIIHEGGEPGPFLTALVSEIAQITQRPATLTYEDVVITNPARDLRTATNGEVGISEAGFYSGHRFIEEVLKPSVEKAFQIVEGGREMAHVELLGLLAEIYQSMQLILQYTGEISIHMPVEHFAGGFRKYLGTLEKQGLAGASGAFTANVPLLEYLLLGELIPEEDILYQLAHLQYFPLPAQSLLLQALTNAQNGQSVHQMLKSREKTGSEKKELVQVMKEIIVSFRRFREVHLKAVDRHLGTEPDQEVVGTGGTTRHFLLRRLERYDELLRTFDL